MNIVEILVHMNANGEMRHVETFLGMRGKGIKENGGGSEFNYDICKNFCKCRNVPSEQQ
jgi:hypothetical protein